MISQLRYNLKIVAPTLIITGILVSLLVALVMWANFRNRAKFTVEEAGGLAEQLVPLIAAFFSAGVLDAELKRGVHELLASKRRPLWHTVAYRLAVSVGLALTIGAGILAAVHFGIRKVPFGMLMAASIPSALCLALISLWVRVRLGNAFIGHTIALAVWLFNVFTGALLPRLGISFNPLFTLNSYSDRLHASAAGALETTPYVDWWWVNKLALVVVSAFIFASITRRVELLVEGD